MRQRGWYMGIGTVAAFAFPCFHYEAAAMIQLSHLHLMLRQLTPVAQPAFRYDAAT